jgi:hypothetical protein
MHGETEKPCIRILTHCIRQSPCLLHAYHKTPLYYTRFFSSILNTSAVYRSLEIDFFRVIRKIISESKRSRSFYQFFSLNLAGCECHSDLNIMSRAIVEACDYSRHFVADKGLYLNSKLAVFETSAFRGVAGAGMMGPP